MQKKTICAKQKPYSAPVAIVIVLIVLATVALSPIFAAASNETHTVSFLTSGGLLIRSCDVASGDTIPDSAVPTVADIIATVHDLGEIVGWWESVSGCYYTTDTSKIDGEKVLGFQNYVVSGNLSFYLAYANPLVYDESSFTAASAGNESAGNVAPADTGAGEVGQTGQAPAASASAQSVSPSAAAIARETAPAPETEMSQQAEIVEMQDIRTPSESMPSAGNITGGLSGLEQGTGMPIETIQALIRDGFSDAEILQMGKQTGNILVDLESDSVPLGDGSVRNAWSLLSMLMAVAAAIMVLHIKIFVEKRPWKTEEEQYRILQELQTVAVTIGGLTLVLWFMVDNLSRPLVWTNRYTGYVAFYFVMHLVLYGIYRSHYQKMRRLRRRAKARHRRPQAMGTVASRR
jgi:hypothetical protein